ncbi:hypothetical protein Hanom_Chr04g00341811 [Helianthus anomalus]
MEVSFFWLSGCEMTRTIRVTTCQTIGTIRVITCQTTGTIRVTTCQTTGIKSVILKFWELKVKFHQTTRTIRAFYSNVNIDENNLVDIGHTRCYGINKPQKKRKNVKPHMHLAC